MRKPLVFCLPVAVAALCVAGCSGGPEREYALPKALCGVPVAGKALSVLMPPGENVTAKESTPVPDALTTCEVKVDGKLVLSVERERREAGVAARDIAVDQLSVKRPRPAAARTIAYADWAGVSVVRCGETHDEDISTVIRVLKPGRPDETAMKNLISDYTSALRKQNPCEK